MIQINRTNDGLIVVSGAQYLAPGTMVPFTYNSASDTSSSPEIRQEAQKVLNDFRKSLASGDVEADGDIQSGGLWSVGYPKADTYADVPGYLDMVSIPKVLMSARKQRLNPHEKGLPKRIYNPVTGKYYEIRQRSSKHGEAGQIKGLWSSKKVSKKVK